MTELNIEHIKWCKERALAYLDKTSKFYNVQEAITSMMSDMRKDPTTAELINSDSMNFITVMTLGDLTHDNVKKYIEGFP